MARKSASWADDEREGGKVKEEEWEGEKGMGVREYEERANDAE